MKMVFRKEVATEPFPFQSAKQEMKGGLVVTGQRFSLTPLKVLIGNESISAGSTVYVPSDRYVHPWGKTQYELGDLKFILVPETEIVLVDAENYPSETVST